MSEPAVIPVLVAVFGFAPSYWRTTYRLFSECSTYLSQLCRLHTELRNIGTLLSRAAVEKPRFRNECRRVTEGDLSTGKVRPCKQKALNRVCASVQQMQTELKKARKRLRQRYKSLKIKIECRRAHEDHKDHQVPTGLIDVIQLSLNARSDKTINNCEISKLEDIVAEDSWYMRVDDPLCVALAPAAHQM